MTPRLRVAVLGEGKDERGPARAIAPFGVVPRRQQGAMEILVRRKLYALLRAEHEADWHAGLDDGIDVVQPPPTRQSMVQVLSDRALLALVVVGALKPVGVPPHVDLLVATHDAEDDAGSIAAVAAVNASLGTRVPLLLPFPEIQAWLTSKRAVERVYDHEHCTVPEVDEGALNPLYSPTGLPGTES